MHNFIHKHIEQFVELHPRNECLETPINDPVKETHETPYGYSWTRTTITPIDNA
jgi:hypothetical protein